MADRIVVMNHGVIEQVGSPEEIYLKPETAFVADFVGRMSFLAGVAQGHGAVDVNGIALTCADDRGFAAGSRVEVGLRPEAIQVRGVSASDTNALTVTVEDLEFLGSFGRARLNAGGRLEVIADFSANLMRDMHVVAGQTLTVSLPPDALRVFPARTGA